MENDGVRFADNVKYIRPAMGGMDRNYSKSAVWVIGIIGLTSAVLLFWRDRAKQQIKNS
jgi:hypothetical protein